MIDLQFGGHHIRQTVRAGVSASTEIAAEVGLGDQMAIMGQPIEADGYRWYPVEVVADGTNGFIAQDFILPLSD